MSADPASTYVALLHHPMRDVTGAIVTTALTTLDLHDIARTCRTYGIAGYFIVHPIPAQRSIAERITTHWNEDGRHDFRKQALDRVTITSTLEEAEAQVEARTGRRARLVATSAKAQTGAIPLSALQAMEGPTLLLLGTGFGMSETLLARADCCLLPLRGPSDYNHLSVRSACAILLDRLYGDRKD